MNDRAISQTFEDQVRAAVAVPDPEPGFTEALRARLRAQIPPRPVLRTLPLRRAWAVGLLVALILGGALLAIGPERAWAAVQRLLGYIPGVGFVEDTGRLLALERPVSQTREGITFTVSQVIADPGRTVLVYQVDGLSIDAANSQGEGAANLGSLGMLVLPDGMQLEQNGGDGNGWGSGYRMRLLFPALPAGVDRMTFRLPRLNDIPPGAAPENWEVPLRLVPAPPSLTVAPVIELTPTASARAEPYGISLSIDRVVTLDDGYLVVGSTRWDGSTDFPAGLMPTGLIRAFDANGAEVPIEWENADTTAVLPQDRSFPWAYRLQGKSFAGPLTFTLEDIDAWFPAEGSFTFDAGPSPQVGQTWKLGQELTLAGHRVTVVSAERQADSRGGGYEFTFTADPDVVSVSITLPSAPPTGGGGGGGPSGEFTSRLDWAGGPPVGELTLRIDRVDLVLHGPWRVEWQPPIPASPQATATPQTGVCFTLEPGRSAAAYSHAPLPPDLGGHLLLYGPMEGYSGYVISSAKLDGSDRAYIGQGTWPSYSADGSMVAYSGSDGLHVHDLVSGSDVSLPETNENDYHPLWSPAGDRIAFVRGAGAFDLFVIGADGSGLRRLTSNPAYEELAGWTPDGESVVYTAPGAGGVGEVRSVDVAGGASQTLFRLQGQVKSVGAAVSPDGAHIAYTDALFGNAAGGLYLSRLDGSGRRLIAALGYGGLSAPVWSPDGRWLAARIPDGSDPVPVAMVIQPEACAVIVLDQLKGEVAGWGP